MGYRFTEDDEGKDLMTAHGTRVGLISAVDDERATIDTNDGHIIDEGVIRLLGWEDGGETEIWADHVNQVREDRITLNPP